VNKVGETGEKDSGRFEKEEGGPSVRSYRHLWKGERSLKGWWGNPCVKGFIFTFFSRRTWERKSELGQRERLLHETVKMKKIENGNGQGGRSGGKSSGQWVRRGHFNIVIC